MFRKQVWLIVQSAIVTSVIASFTASVGAVPANSRLATSASLTQAQPTRMGSARDLATLPVPCQRCGGPTEDNAAKPTLVVPIRETSTTIEPLRVDQISEKPVVGVRIRLPF